MGYESRLIVGFRNHCDSEQKAGHKDFCQTLMVLELSCVGAEEFNNRSNKLFDKEIDFDLYMDDGDTCYYEDKYGDVCHYTSISNVIKFLAEYNKTQDYYRRTDFALKALKSFKKKDWCWKKGKDYGELVVVHYAD